MNIMNIMNEMDENEHITYNIEEDEKYDNDDLNIRDLLDEFEKMDVHSSNPLQDDVIFAQMSDYDLNFNIKQLTTICEYYGIKVYKMKKIEIINTIVAFEMISENIEIVMKRQQLWRYMQELKEDKFMKKFILCF